MRIILSLGNEMECDNKLKLYSNVINSMLEDEDDDNITLPIDVCKENMEMIIDCLSLLPDKPKTLEDYIANYEKGQQTEIKENEPVKPIIPHTYQEKINEYLNKLPMKTIFKLIEAVHYLDITDLEKMISKNIADTLIEFETEEEIENFIESDKCYNDIE